MSSQDQKNSMLETLRNLGWPIILGLAAYIVFCVLMKQGVIDNPLIVRYVGGHPVSYIATGMFFIGVVALALKSWDVASQYRSLARVELDEPPAAGQPVEQCGTLLDALQAMPARVRRSYLWKRLHDVLQHVERKDSADGLDDELKYLSDLDANRQQDSYALVRILIWATPMLGFLGTVMGITQALGGLKPEELGNGFQAAMSGLLAGLYIAFDTTALALSLSIFLMFCQFLVDRFETQLLDTVDKRVNDELVGRFAQIGGRSDPQVRSIERMGQSVINASEQLVQRQTQLWESTINAAHQQWQHLSDATGGQLLSAFNESLDQVLERHAARMAKADQAAAEQLRLRWEQWQVSLSDNARILHSQQKELVKLGETMMQVLQATGEIANLEQALNNNLRTLAGAGNFEETVLSLSAAIHLLNLRLGRDVEPRIELNKIESQGRAA